MAGARLLLLLWTAVLVEGEVVFASYKYLITVVYTRRRCDSTSER